MNNGEYFLLSAVQNGSLLHLSSYRGLDYNFKICPEKQVVYGLGFPEADQETCFDSECSISLFLLSALRGENYFTRLHRTAYFFLWSLNQLV